MKAIIGVAALVAALTVGGLAFSQTTGPSAACESIGVCQRLDAILEKINQPPTVTIPPGTVKRSAVFIDGAVAGPGQGPVIERCTAAGCAASVAEYCRSIGYPNGRAVRTYTVASGGIAPPLQYAQSLVCYES